MSRKTGKEIQGQGQNYAISSTVDGNKHSRSNKTREVCTKAREGVFYLESYSMTSTQEAYIFLVAAE